MRLSRLRFLTPWCGVGLQSALEHAMTLMRPEHRSQVRKHPRDDALLFGAFWFGDRFLTRLWSCVAQISDTYKRKIESMVRKGSKNADSTFDPDEPSTPCPSCRCETSP